METTVTPKTKITAAFRLKVYKAMLKLIEESIEKTGEYSTGFCSALRDVSILKNTPELCRMYIYEELAAFKPKVTFGNYWLPTDARGDQTRMRILRRIIYDMEH